MAVDRRAGLAPSTRPPILPTSQQPALAPRQPRSPTHPPEQSTPLIRLRSSSDPDPRFIRWCQPFVLPHTLSAEHEAGFGTGPGGAIGISIRSGVSTVSSMQNELPMGPE